MKATNALSLDCNKLTTLISDKPPQASNNTTTTTTTSDQQNRHQLHHRRTDGQNCSTIENRIDQNADKQKRNGSDELLQLSGCGEVLRLTLLLIRRRMLQLLFDHIDATMRCGELLQMHFGAPISIGYAELSCCGYSEALHCAPLHLTAAGNRQLTRNKSETFQFHFHVRFIFVLHLLSCLSFYALFSFSLLLLLFLVLVLAVFIQQLFTEM